MGGIAHVRRCVFTCAPVMAVMALAHSVFLMVALTVVLCPNVPACPTRTAGPGGRWRPWCWPGWPLVWTLGLVSAGVICCSAKIELASGDDTTVGTGEARRL